MGKKGLSLEEKRQRILEIYYEKKEVFNLKEIEKLGAKRGVVFQTIKDINQSLVDDNLVQFDKIGAGAFFWSLPSEGFQSRQNLLTNVSTHISDIDTQLETIEKEAALQTEKRVEETSDNVSREGLLAEFSELKAKGKQIQDEIKKYERCDPTKLNNIKAKVKTCKEAAIRWTDNLFEMESYMKKTNPSITRGDIEQNFPILKDLDYPGDP